MLRNFTCLVLLLGVSVARLQAQDNPYTDSLKTNLEHATSTRDKIRWMGELSIFYLPINKEQSDNYASQLQQLAEQSRDRELMASALLINARRFSSFTGIQANINIAMEYAQKALALAKANHMEEYEAWSYLRMASCARASSNNEKALNYDNLASSIAASSENDSLKVEAYISIAQTYLRKDDKMLGFRNLLRALDVAETKKGYNYYEQRDAYYALSDFYSDLEEWEKAKDYIYKAIALTHKFKIRYDRLTFYNQLGRIYAANQQYDIAGGMFEKALALADTLKFEVIKFNTYDGMMGMYIAAKQPEKALDLIRKKPTIKEVMKSAGFYYYLELIYGMVYTKMDKLDSADYYYRKAEPAINANTSLRIKYEFYDNMGTLAKKQGNYKRAIEYWKKSEAIANTTGNLQFHEETAQKLDSCYQHIGDFKNAYYYNRQFQLYADSIKRMSTEKDLMLLEVENENKRKEREEIREVEATRARHNIQYMGITVAIACVFIILTMFGIFRVSSTTIRILGFFAFIFLFEFIILLADNQIHHWTHGEPWKVMAIKIVLISVLLPLHHFIEEKVIHYLTSRKMLELNKAALLAKFVSRKEEEN
ncbi:MAG TPA: hypothetical protein VIN08_18225 [Ohtaekwangia sp.]|uniref:tetratricopeptide repeat protein n=1 Tax=Ohtaekwangia sp. TaxID=2066019 RepID=UPI002F95E414